MKATELVKLLKKSIKEHGDRNVLFDLEPTGGDFEYNLCELRAEAPVVSHRQEGVNGSYSRRSIILRPNYSATGK
jgi:hypothetical protein